MNSWRLPSPSFFSPIASPADRKRAKTDASSGEYEYMPGFGNHFSTEALPGALPKGMNNPQKCPYNLYNECLSGTAFTAPRDANQRTWLYRIRPSVCHRPFKKIDRGAVRGAFENEEVNPNQVSRGLCSNHADVSPSLQFCSVSHL